MKKGIFRIGMFLVQLAGFALGGVAGWFLAALAAWLALGAPQGERSAIVFAPMLVLGPVGFFLGGFIGMRLAGKWLKAASNSPTGPGTGGGHD